MYFLLNTYKDVLFLQSKAVETIGKKGLKIIGNGVSYKIKLLKNAKELKETIMSMLGETAQTSHVSQPTQQNQNVASSAEGEADAIMKYKDMLDSGIITQEEFDAKKKQILGL